MKKITLCIIALIFGCFFTVSAQHTFAPAGPVTVVNGAPETVAINDAGNSAAAPAGVYNEFSVSVDWVAGNGGPYSSEADLTIITSAGQVLIDPATSGSAGDGNPTTMIFSGALPGDYDPSVDGFLELELNQSWQGSDAVWSNITVTIDFTPPPPAPDCAEEPISPADGAVDVLVPGGDLTFTWTAPAAGPPPTEYEFFFGTDPNDLASLAVVTDTTIDLINVGFGTTFYWQVVPLNGISPAVGCDVWSFSTESATAPTTVGNLTINGCGDSDMYMETYTIGNVTWVELTYDGGCDALTVDTFTSTIGDSEIGLYNDSGNIVGTNDDAAAGGLLSSLTVEGLTAGTYYVAASAYDTTFSQGFNVTTADVDDVGDLVINASTVVPNDECVNAIAVNLNEEITVDNVGATDSGVVGSCDSGIISDVWYSFVATSTTEAYFVTDAPHLSLWDACGGTELACNPGDNVAVTGLTDGTTYYVRVNDDGTARAPGTFTLIIGDALLSVESFDNESAFTYFPNPVKNTLTLNAQSSIEKVVMYNILGQEVLRVNPNTVDSEIDMSALVDGTYFVKLSINNSTETIRVIKQ